MILVMTRLLPSLLNEIGDDVIARFSFSFFLLFANAENYPHDKLFPLDDFNISPNVA